MQFYLSCATIFVAAIGMGYMLGVIIRNLPLTNRRLFIGGALTAIGAMLLLATILV